MIARAARPAPRRGLTVVAVLVCLMIITMISMSVLRMGRAEREAARAEERALQAEWLAEAGIDRARARLAADPDYQGETWNIAPADLDRHDGARVVIAVERTPGAASRPVVHVVADFPPELPRRSRCSRRVDFEGPGPGR